MPEVKIIAKNFMDMVASLPAMKLDKLYDNAFICEAILRSLPFPFIHFGFTFRGFVAICFFSFNNVIASDLVYPHTHTNDLNINS